MTNLKHGVWYPLKEHSPIGLEEVDVWAKHYDNKNREWIGKRIANFCVGHLLDDRFSRGDWEPTHFMLKPLPPEDL